MRRPKRTALGTLVTAVCLAMVAGLAALSGPSGNAAAAPTPDTLTVAYPLEPIIARHPNVERILCGHLHRTIFRRFGGTIAATAPSPAHQVVLDFLPDAPSQFAMEPPGYLLHRWNEREGATSYGVTIGDYDGPYPFYEGGKLIE